MKGFKLSVFMLTLMLALAGCGKDTDVAGEDSTGSQNEQESVQSELEDSQNELEDSQNEVDDSQSEVEDSQTEIGTTTPEKPDEEPLKEGWTRLTKDELKYFNEQFFNVSENRILNAFLYGEYEDVKNIGLEELFYDCPDQSTVEITEEEKGYLRGSKIDFDTDFQKIPASYMDEMLRAYANISLEESNKVDLDEFLYLKGYDAYYSGHGDTNYFLVDITSGQKNKDGIIKLQYQHEIWNEPFEVILKEHDNGYYFVSNLPVNYEEPLGDGWKRLSRTDIKYFNKYFFSNPSFGLIETPEDGLRLNAFLTCTYTDVKDINFRDVFYDVYEEVSDAEYAALEKLDVSIDLDITKISASHMDELLRTHANISLKETNKVDLDDFVYLKEYDAYYLASGDTNYSPVYVESGVKDENGNVKLQCLFSDRDEMYTVTLKAHENGYYFVSNVLNEK